MAGLVPAILDLFGSVGTSWRPGLKPGMTEPPVYCDGAGDAGLSRGSSFSLIAVSVSGPTWR